MKKRTSHPVKLLCSVLLCAALMCSCLAPTFAATYEEWIENWDTLKNDNSSVALMPGSDSSEMKFTWLSDIKDFAPKFELSEKQNMQAAKRIEVTSSLTVYGFKNTVSLKNLKSDTTYYYRITKDKNWSEIYSFKTANDDNFNVLFISDSQIGRSGDEKLDEVLKHDSLGWNNTLEAACSYEPDISLVVSAGDQVETAYTQEQYNLFFAPDKLREIPVATAIGNHDFYFPLYSVRTANPNQFDRELLQCPAGKGYYFKRGEALFIVINSNNFLTLDHEELIDEAMDFYPDALWRIVVMHHSIYSRDEENNFSRPLFSAMFDKYNIDLVLSGHDHIYLRSCRLYDSQRVEEGGTVYLQANSASGSNYDGAPNELPWYAESCLQPRVPTYTILNFTDGKISISTLRSDTNEIIDEYEMTKNKPTKTVVKDSIIKKIYRQIADKIFEIKNSCK